MSATASLTVKYTPSDPSDSNMLDWCSFSITLPPGFANTNCIFNTNHHIIIIIIQHSYYSLKTT
ncbi:hypothetical protein HanIR_Chr09g0447481 [Helianthus annuus]|nr:hypothetical protein HanIR_Chr09g0447481 [Helianthus annuus]